MNAELKNTAGGAFDGSDVPGVPQTAVSIYGEYDTPWVEDLTLTGRVVYGGSTYYDRANTQKVPDWTRVDLGARYIYERQNGKPIELRASVANVFNENYWATSARGFLSAARRARSCSRHRSISEPEIQAERSRLLARPFTCTAAAPGSGRCRLSLSFSVDAFVGCADLRLGLARKITYLALLMLDVDVGKAFGEPAAHRRIILEALEGRLECLRQADVATGGKGLRAQERKIFLCRLRHRETLLDALYPGMNDCREGKSGLAVASAARNSKLNWAARAMSLMSETGQMRTDASRSRKPRLLKAALQRCGVRRR